MPHAVTPSPSVCEQSIQFLSARLDVRRTECPQTPVESAYLGPGDPHAKPPDTLNGWKGKSYRTITEFVETRTSRLK